MTVAQLKRHMDRRLRKKADKADVRRLERRMDAGFVGIYARFKEVDARFDKMQGWLAEQFRDMKEHIDRVMGEHEARLRDLENASRQRSETTQ